jgi:hypothetical protein
MHGLAVVLGTCLPDGELDPPGVGPGTLSPWLLASAGGCEDRILSVTGLSKMCHGGAGLATTARWGGDLIVFPRITFLLVKVGMEVSCQVCCRRERRGDWHEVHVQEGND